MARCQLGGRFSRCRSAAVQTCQYCGRGFCQEHAYHLEGHDAVCSRKRCRAKWDDLARHVEYRRAVATRNEAGVCGLESCSEVLSGQCSLCRGRFCRQHIRRRRYPLNDGVGGGERLLSTCPRCWERRKLWRRLG